MRTLRQFRVPQLLQRAAIPTLALVTAFLAGAIVIVLTDFEHLQHLGTDPAGAIGGAVGGVIEGYRALAAGAIGDPARIVAAIQGGSSTDVANAIRPLTEALISAMPYVFVGLGVAVAFHAGLLNLGADGQFLIGGLGAGIAVALLAGRVPPPLVLLGGFAGGALLGATYGFVPGFLKARTGAHEVITTLMLNAVAPDLAFLIAGSGIFSGPPVPIPQIPLIFDLPAIRLDWGLLAVVPVTVAVSVLLFRTRLGFELRATGFSPNAARGAGMRPGRTTMLAMAISGGLIGLGSGILGLGQAGGGFRSFGDLGFVALALALIAGLRPSGVVLVALLYGALTNGAKSMTVATGIPLALLLVIITFAMLFVAAPGLVRSIWRLKPARPLAEAEAAVTP
jgi:simple sugar transport system permease protein